MVTKRNHNRSTMKLKCTNRFNPKSDLLHVV